METKFIDFHILINFINFYKNFFGFPYNNLSIIIMPNYKASAAALTVIIATLN